MGTLGWVKTLPVVAMIPDMVNYALLAGGAAVQAPQIWRILRCRSTEGLAESAFLLQTIASGSYCVYNYLMGIPFLSWGDSFMVEIEYCVIVGCIWLYGSNTDPVTKRPRSETVANVRKMCLTVFLLLLVYAVARDPRDPANPPSRSPIVALIGILPTPLVLMSRVPQIMLSHKTKSTGMLSLPSLVMQCGGNMVRVLMTFFIVKNNIVLLSHASAFLLNFISLCQVIYFTHRHLLARFFGARPKQL